MSLNLNTALYSLNGVDPNSVAKVSSQILKAENKTQPTVQNIDYSKFNRANLGVDLYSSRTNADLQKQIALTQAGLYAKAVDVAKLNSSAAVNLYSAQTVQKNVSLMQSSTAAVELTAPRQLEQKNIVQLFNISDKNSNSSNSFNPFETSEEKAIKEEKSETDTLNLFA